LIVLAIQSSKPVQCVSHIDASFQVDCDAPYPDVLKSEARPARNLVQRCLTSSYDNVNGTKKDAFFCRVFVHAGNFDSENETVAQSSH